MNLRTGLLLAWSMFGIFSQAVRGAEPESAGEKAIEAISPDGKFAFRDTPASKDEAEGFDLVNRPSGKVLIRVAEADFDPSPSSRFLMKVLWRPDSKAFALTGTLWKRGSYLAVFLRDGATFREVKLPDLWAEIPKKEGQSFPHIVSNNSQSAKRWQKDGSLTAEILTIQDGLGPTATALRTVVLGFGTAGETKILKSTIKVTVETP